MLTLTGGPLIGVYLGIMGMPKSNIK
jgi:hypothetical protein